MAQQINVRTFKNRRIDCAKDVVWGCTSIIEELKDIPFNIKRVFYIYGSDLNLTRGGHRLKKATQGLICLCGSYEIFVDNGKCQETFILKSPEQLLILNNEDWHTMKNLSADSMLLVLSSEYYDVADYIDDPYPSTPREIVEQVYGKK